MQVVRQRKRLALVLDYEYSPCRRSLSRDFKRKISKKTKLMLTRRAEFQRAHEKCLTFYSLFFFSFCSSDGLRRKNKDHSWSMSVLEATLRCAHRAGDPKVSNLLINLTWRCKFRLP